MMRRFALLLCVCLLASMIPAGLAEDLEAVEVLEDAAGAELFEAEEHAAEVGEIALEAEAEPASNGAEEPVAKGKKEFVVIDEGLLVEYNGKGGKVTLPKKVKQIWGTNIFKNNVTEIVFPKTMDTIMDSVFDGKTKLKKVTFKSNVFLGEYVFAGCTSLKTVVLPKGFTDIGYGNFLGCTSLKSISFPSTLKTIGTNAFSDSGLKGALTLPAKLKEIGEGTFYNCKSLTSVVFPASLKRIGIDAFAHCAGLKSVTFLNKNTQIEETAFMDTVWEEDDDDVTLLPINPNLVIYGYEGSTAEKYAKAAGYAFKALPTAVKLNKTGTVKLKKGKKLTLTATLTPASAEAALTWKSSNKKVAKVSKTGVVKAVGKGTATITVTTANGKTKKVKIKVK